jgi:hypothetical protein
MTVAIKASEGGAEDLDGTCGGRCHRRFQQDPRNSIFWRKDMPQFEIRCNTEWIMVVEADDEKTARKIAEDTDFSEWDRADSLYEVEPLEKPAEPVGALPLDDSVPQPSQHADQRSYWLRLDMPLFQRQQELLNTITDLARHGKLYVPAPGDAELLNGLLEVTDAVAGHHEDKEGG